MLVIFLIFIGVLAVTLASFAFWLFYSLTKGTWMGKFLRNLLIYILLIILMFLFFIIWG